MRSRAIMQARRAWLEQWIDRAIALLDDIDGDPDDEPYLAGAMTDREWDDAELDRPGFIRGGQGR